MKLSKNNIFYHLGNLMIGAALLILLYTYYPIIVLFIHPPVINYSALQKGEYIVIPKINAEARIIENVNPWNEAEYSKALEKGVAQARGTALLGQVGTIYLFAHSSEDPWKITRENISFLRLGELSAGDSISVYKEGKVYRYHVQEKKEIWPNEVSYLTKSSGNKLILQTCTPIGTSFKRLLVIAVPVN